MSDEKKIIFSATDNVSTKANQIAGTILSNAQKYSNTLKEQLSYINQQIKALEKKQTLEQKDTKEESRALFGSARGATNKSEASYYAKQALSTEEKLKKDTVAGEKGFEVLKKLLDEFKKNATIAEKTEKEIEKENRRKSKYEDLRQARQEVKTDRKGVKSRIAKTEEEGYGDMTSGEIERLNYQKGVLNQEKSESNFKSTLKALLVNDLVKGIANGITTAVSAPTGEQGANSLLGMLPGVGSLFSSAANRSFEEQVNVGIGINKMKAMSGQNINLGGNASLGFSSRESLGLQEGLLSAAGNASNLDRNVSQSQSLEKGLGLSQSTIIGIVDAMRTIRSSDDVVGVVSKVIKANPELLKDQTKLSGIIENTLSLTKSLAGQTENVNKNQVTSLFGALRSVGGTFADQNLGLRNANTINGALTNPQNDFQKARSFGVLSSLNPGASYFKLLEMKEKGLGQEGYLAATLKQLKRETGGGENFALSTMTNLGLGASTSRRLTEAFSKNPKMFENFKGEVSDESITNILSPDRAKDLTNRRDQESAQQSEKYLKGAIEGAFEGITQTFGDAINKFSTSTDKLSQVVDKKYGDGSNGKKNQ